MMNTQLLQQTMIFRGMSEEEINTALARLCTGEKKYKKGSAILRAGSTTDLMGLVLEGSVTIENNDVWGNKTILSHVGENQFFAETYGYLKDEMLLVDVIANEDCRIMFLRIGSLRGMVSAASPWTIKLLMNLLTISTHKNLALSGRSFHIAPRTMRGKILAYLNSIALQKHATEFDIPFNRQQLADYLNVERTALSKELSRMQADGLIRFRRSHFILDSCNSHLSK